MGEGHLQLTSDDPLIVWFDYTTKLGFSELQDIVLLLGALGEKDIARFTFNAQAKNYVKFPEKEDEDDNVSNDTAIEYSSLTEEREREYRYDYFSDLYSTAGLDPEELSKELKDYASTKLPSLIVKALDDIAMDTMGENHELDFEILSSVHYKDGANMVTITGAIIKGIERKTLKDRMNINSWKFKPKPNYQPFKLTLQQMTFREYLTLDRFASSNEDIVKVKAALNFSRIGDHSIEKVYEEFKLISRFYPSFLEVAT